jgi:hypothetical protein
VFFCVARYKYLTPTEPVAGFAAAPADMLPGLTLFKTVLDFLELAIG